MTVWQVQIAGHSGDLGRLAETLVESDLAVVEDGNEYFVTAAGFASLSSPAEVAAASRRLVDLLNGVIRILPGFDLSVDEPVTIVGVRRFDEVAESRRFRDLRASIPIGSARPTRVARWLALAVTDTRVARVLRLVGESSWWSHREIVEIIESDCGEMSIANRNWASDRELSRLKQTASAAAARDDGAVDLSALRSAMMPRAAEVLVRRLVTNWLDSKLT